MLSHTKLLPLKYVFMEVATVWYVATLDVLPSKVARKYSFFSKCYQVLRIFGLNTVLKLFNQSDYLAYSKGCAMIKCESLMKIQLFKHYCLKMFKKPKICNIHILFHFFLSTPSPRSLF